MRIDPEDHFEAALERRETARRLLAAGDFVPAIYLAGVAVESLLRAFRPAVAEAGFTGRHDLPRLLEESDLEVPPPRRRAFGAAFGDLWMRWKNDYRYCSADRLERRYRKLGLRAKRGDTLEANARIAVNAAFTVVSLGASEWKRSKPR